MHFSYYFFLGLIAFLQAPAWGERTDLIKYESPAPSANPHANDFYARLGLRQEDNPTTEQIKSAYRRLARQTHPDLHPGMGDKEFKNLAEAFEVLGDPKRRAFYDSWGAAPGIRFEDLDETLRSFEEFLRETEARMKREFEEMHGAIDRLNQRLDQLRKNPLISTTGREWALLMATSVMSGIGSAGWLSALGAEIGSEHYFLISSAPFHAVSLTLLNWLPVRLKEKIGPSANAIANGMVVGTVTSVCPIVARFFSGLM